jgi:flagellar biogenesis protein FliO
MISSIPIRFRLWPFVALLCASSVSNVIAQDAPARRINAPATKPASALISQSLGLSASILAIGAVLLIAGRHYQSRLIKSGRPGPVNDLSDRPQVTGRIRLTPRQSVHVVRVGGRVLVLGTGPQGSPELLTEWHADLESQDHTFQDLNRLDTAPSLTILPDSEAAA